MKSQMKFHPQIETLEDRLTPSTMQLTLPHVGAPIASSVVLTLPTTPPAPPPAPTDDPYENNDSFAAAHDIGTLIGGSLNAKAAKSITGLMLTDNADWFKFTTTMTGAAGSGVSIRFDNSLGDLNLRLFDSVGTQIGASHGLGNREAISLAGVAPGTYVVQVRGLAGVHNPSYNLAVKQAVLLVTPQLPPVVPVIPPIVPPTVPQIPPPPANGYNITLRMTGLTADQQTVFQQAANRWGQIITADVPDATFQGIAVDDLLIDVSVNQIDGSGNIAAETTADLLRPISLLPIHATMVVDVVDLALLQSTNTLFDVALHEMGHALGFGTIWTQKGLTAGGGVIPPIFIGPLATFEYNQIFKTNAIGVPVDASGVLGTTGAHWDETIFGDELMTGTVTLGVTAPLSRVTAASMADLGYTVNLNAADPYTPP